MIRAAWTDDQILRTIVGPILVPVMNGRAGWENMTKCSLCYENVFEDVAIAMGALVGCAPNKDIAIHDRSTPAPAGVIRAVSLR